MNVQAFPDFHRANMARERWLDSLDKDTRVAFHDDIQARYQADMLALITPRIDGAYILTIKPAEI